MIEYDISDLPTILVLDANDQEICRVGLVTPKQIIQHEEAVRAQELLPMIEQTLVEAGLELSQLRAICVIKREGSLTGQRIGATVANTLAWLSSTPIIQLHDVTFNQALTQLQERAKFTIHKTATAN